MRSAVPFLALCALLSAAPRARAQDPGEAAGRRDVAIFVYEGVELLDFAGPGEVFAAARAGRQRAFRVYTVAETREPVTSQGFVRITPEYSFEDCPTPDVLVLPGGNVPTGRPEVVEWVRRIGPEASVAMSVCNGALLLGHAGLLDGLEVTTHHGSTLPLALLVPTATIRPDRRFVDSGHVLTAAGVSAGIDGALHLVSRLLGEEAARGTAYYMEYRWDPEGADEYHRRALAPDDPRPALALIETLEKAGVEAALGAWEAMAEPPGEDDLNRAGYILLDAKRPSAARRVFALNAARHPGSANAWDSLAEAQEAAGLRADALRSTRRCLALLGTWSHDEAFKERVREGAFERLLRLRGPTDLGIGQPAPDFALRDAGGRAHRLSDHRGRVTVLEWTRSGCPAVEAAERHGPLGALRARGARGEVAWLAIDSSHDCAERAAAAAGGGETPYLLDPSGLVGRMYGATTTPSVFVVDGRGTLAYVGAADENLAAALDALAAGETVLRLHAPPVGRAIAYAPLEDAGEWKCAPCGVDCHERTYDGPGACADCGMQLIPLIEYERLVAGASDG